MLSLAQTDFVLRVDKRVGPTSHDVVQAARRSFGTRRVGHTGTLDPFASGLLLLCFNRATRLVEYLTGLPKVYHATAQLDAFTDTDDATGTFIEQSEAWRGLDRDQIMAAMRGLVGTQRQRPPDYSAKRIDGERSYRLARRGIAVEPELVEITVYRFDLVAMNLPIIEFEVECTSGTYIRALARDLGRALGTGGYLTELRRTRVGPFGIEGAIPSDEFYDASLRRSALLTPLAALAGFPRLEVSAEEARRLRLGQSILFDRESPPGHIVVHQGPQLIAIARAEEGRIRPTKVWQAAE